MRAIHTIFLLEAKMGWINCIKHSHHASAYSSWQATLCIWSIYIDCPESYTNSCNNTLSRLFQIKFVFLPIHGQTSNIIESQNLNVSGLVLQLFIIFQTVSCIQDVTYYEKNQDRQSSHRHNTTNECNSPWWFFWWYSWYTRVQKIIHWSFSWSYFMTAMKCVMLLAMWAINIRHFCLEEAAWVEWTPSGM